MARLSILIATLVLVVSTPFATAQEATPAALPLFFKELVAAWNAHDAQRVVAIYATDAVVEEAVLGSPVRRGSDEITAWVEANFAALPDLRIEPRAGYVTDDRAVLEWVYTGTYTGQFPGLPPGTGQAVSFPGVSVYHLQDGQIVHDTLYYDSALLLSQLGLMAAPGASPVATPTP